MTKMRTLEGRVHEARSSSATPTVTVVIPCFNYARYLPEAVGSALSQDGVVVDVVVVDDASTDDSLAIAEALVGQDARVSVIRNKVNSGAVKTFNRGLAAATGEYLVRLDADDLLTPGSLSRSVALLESHPNVGMVYGHPIHFHDGVLPEARTTATAWTVWDGREWLAARCASGTNVITSPEVVMRHSVVRTVGGQRDLAHTHDMEMWLRIAGHSDVGYVTGCDQAWHRDHPASLSVQAEAPLVILGEIRDAFEVLFESVEPRGLDSLWRRAVAVQAVRYASRDIDRGRVSAESEALWDFARRVDPTVSASRAGRVFVRNRRLVDVLPKQLIALRGIGPRLRRRIAGEVASRRWRMTGVYEPTRLRRTFHSTTARRAGR